MNKYILSLFWIALTGILHPAGAQVDTAWVRVWNSVSYGQNIAVDDGGNVYVGGGTGGLTTVAYDSGGQQIWTRYFGGHDSYVGRLIEMHLNSRGDITLLSSRGAVVRYNTLGDSLWSLGFAFPSPQDTTYPVAIASDDSGNTFITGYWPCVVYLQIRPVRRADLGGGFRRLSRSSHPGRLRYDPRWTWQHDRRGPVAYR